jgi:saccharopine dehydrogenase-like NADP-dependent oxidoreductase
LKELAPRSLGERFTFAEPIGTQFIAGESHSEPVCLSRSFKDRGIKRISYRGSFGDDIEKKISFLRDLGFANRNPIDVKGTRVAPQDVLQALVDNLPPETKKQPNFVGDLVAVVAGVKNGAPVEYRMRVVVTPVLYQKMMDKGCYGAYRAGLCGAAAAVIVGRGQVTAKGVVEPELAIPADRFLEDMVKFGFKVEITEKTFL